jgi:rare lipoprotein A
MLLRVDVMSRFRVGVILGLLALAACSTTGGEPRHASLPRPSHPVTDTPVKVGQPYQVQGRWYFPSDDQAYDEVGLASWYGNDFHGGATANGETYDMMAVGAAHKTLPLPSYVEVTALDTGRTILVRINDRGPFVANRIIDLSYRAAEQLGITSKGVARVRVRRVYPDAADRLALRSGQAAALRPASSAAMLVELKTKLSNQLAAADLLRAPSLAAFSDRAKPDRVAVRSSLPSLSDLLGGTAEAATPASRAVWYVQIGAYAEKSRADRLSASLGGSTEAAGSMFRVRLGPYFDVDKANAALAQAQGQGYQNATLVPPISTR